MLKLQEKRVWKEIARVFEVTSFSGFIHAKNHLRVLEDVNDVTKNLEAAYTGETYEITEMYPKFYEEAKREEQESYVQYQIRLRD